jgi:hypothetical protein
MTPNTRTHTRSLPQWAVVVIVIGTLAFLNLGAPLLVAGVTAGIR